MTSDVHQCTKALGRGWGWGCAREWGAGLGSGKDCSKTQTFAIVTTRGS